MISGISDRAILAQLRSDGLHVRSADLRCRFLLEPTGAAGPSEQQVAYSISRKVGNAVARNRIRRRLRSLFTEVFRADESPPVSCAMVIVLPGARDLSYAALRDQVLELMKKIEKSTGSST